MTVDSVAIADQVIWCFIPGKRLNDLPTNPFGGGMGGHGMVDEPPPTETQDKQAVEQLEADGGHDKQVDGGNSIGVNARRNVFQSCPGGPRRLTMYFATVD
jgi:hypothetical protein